MDDDLHTLTGAYAVHALPYAEWVLFERHLRGCDGCGDEVRRLRETAARLAEPLAVPPPADLRARLLTAAPRRRAPSPPRPKAGAPAGRPPATGVGAADGVSGVRGGPGGGTLVLPLSHGARPSRRGRVLAGVAAVAAAVAVASGVVAFDARRDLGEVRGRQGELLAVLAAPDAETVRRPVASGGTATLVVSRTRGRMVFTSSGLPELPGTRGYELWLMSPAGARPAGMLTRLDGDVTTPVIAAPHDGEERVALTVEPASGSAAPTTTPILLTALPNP